MCVCLRVCLSGLGGRYRLDDSTLLSIWPLTGRFLPFIFNSLVCGKTKVEGAAVELFRHVKMLSAAIAERTNIVTYRTACAITASTHGSVSKQLVLELSSPSVFSHPL